MKIGFILDTPFESNAGAQQVFKRYITQLEKLGHTVKLFGPFWKNKKFLLSDKCVFVGKTFHPLFNTTSVPISANTSKDEIQKALEGNECDIYHIGLPFSPFMGAKLIDLIDKPIIGHYMIMKSNNFTSIGNWFGTLVMRKQIRKVTKILALSETSQNEAETLYRQKIEVIEGCVPVKKNIWNPQKEKIVISSIGRLENRKGFEYLIRAAALLKDKKKIVLQIAGEGPEKDNLKELAERLNVNLILFNYIPEEDKLNFLANSTLCVFPAINAESFGIVLIEALSVGVPVLAFDNPGYSYTLRKILNALVKNKSVIRLASSIQELLDDSKKLKEHSKACFKVAKDYSEATIVTKLLKIYEKYVN